MTKIWIHGTYNVLYVYVLYIDKIIKSTTESPGLPLECIFVHGYKMCWHDWKPQAIVQHVHNS